MTLRIAMQKGLFFQELGTHITGTGTPTQYLDILSTLPAGMRGWIEVTYPDGYVANIHFHAKEAGRPMFTNASFDSADCKAIVSQVGYANACTLLGDRMRG